MSGLVDVENAHVAGIATLPTNAEFIYKYILPSVYPEAH